MLWGRAASMAFPFSVYNIAHLVAGFKSQTHVYCNVIAKAVCLLPFHSLIRCSPGMSVSKQAEPLKSEIHTLRLHLKCNLAEPQPQAPIFDCNGMDGIFYRVMQ